MRLLLLFAALALVNLAALVFAAPVPRPKPKPKEVGPVEIDFSRLPGVENRRDYRLTLSIEFENDNKLMDAGYEIGAGTTPPSVATLVKESLPTIDIEQTGDAKLVIKGYKGNQVVKVGIKIAGIPEGFTPTVRRLPKKVQKK